MVFSSKIKSALSPSSLASTPSNSSLSATSRPLPLKQRTSSLDTRRDYSHTTWSSLLVLLKIREYFVTVDHFSIWRRHLAWGCENGKDLRSYMTQRYSSNMVFMSLLLSTQLAVLFNSAQVTTDVRLALKEGRHYELSFYAGFMILVSSLLTILSLISVFTAWSMVNAVDENNAHCIFRSSIGQYAAELPGRLIVCSIYSFLISFILFFFLLLPVGFWSFTLMLATTAGFVHIVSVFSAFGRVLMHTGAMGKSKIFTAEYEASLVPHALHQNLLMKAQANLANNISISRQYRRKQRPIDRHIPEHEMYNYLCRVGQQSRDDVESPNIPPVPSNRPRADSTVRFADQDTEIKSPSEPSHLRSLTPLSDISAASSSASPHYFTSNDSPAAQPQGIRVPTAPAAMAAATAKKHYGSGQPPAPRRTSASSLLRRPSPPTLPPTSMNPFASNDSLPSVGSRSSLEQWLQASPTGEDERKKVTNNHERGATGFKRLENGIHQQQPPPLSQQQQRPKTVERISSASTEQWLQASPKEGDETTRRNPDSGLLSNDNKMSGYGSTLEDPQLPQRPNAMMHSFGENNTSTTGSNHHQQQLSSLRPPPIMTIDTREQVNINDDNNNRRPYRHSSSGSLSEEDRLFNLDYGEDIDIDNEQRQIIPSRRSSDDAYDDVEYLNDDDHDDEERTSLLLKPALPGVSAGSGNERRSSPTNDSYSSMSNGGDDQRPPLGGRPSTISKKA